MNSFQIDGYQVDQSPVGSGCTGEVFRVKHIIGNKVYLAKRYNSMSIDHHLMKRLFDRYRKAPEHEGIVTLKAFQFDYPPYYSITEFDEGKKLSEARTFREAPAWEITHRLSEALAHSHKYGFVHGNIHPGNIFYHVDEDESIHLRISDFGAGMIGQVHHIDLDERAYFAPPEQLLCLGADYENGKAEKWDVYRFGAVAFWLLNHTIPRGSLYQKVRSQQIAEAEGRPVPVDPVALGTILEKDGKLPWKRRIGSGLREERYKEIIEACLSLNPDKRPVDMREVNNTFLDIERDFTMLETEERAAAELAASESRVSFEKMKQKTKLFTARALVTILGALGIMLTFYLLEYLNRFEEAKMVTNELGQQVTNLKAHKSFLGNQLEKQKEDRQQTRVVMDASFINSMTMRAASGQIEKTFLKDLERSRTYYVGILKEVSAKPGAYAELGRALHSLAHIELKMDKKTEALDHFNKAIENFEKALKSNSPGLDDEHREDTVVRLADCYENTGVLIGKPGSNEALKALSMAIWYLKQVLVNNPEDISAATRLAESSFYLGQTLDKQNRFEEAISAYSSAAEKAVHLRNSSESDEKIRQLEKMISQLQFFAAESLQKVGRRDESTDAYIATIESIERLRSLEGYTREETLMMAKSFLALGDIFNDVTAIDPGDKDQVYNEALRLIVPLNRVSPDNVEIATLMCHSLTRLARLELAANHWRDGYKLSVRGVEVLENALAEHPDDFAGYLQLAEARLNHLEFLEDDKVKARIVSLRGVETATKAHELFLNTAKEMNEPERKQFDVKLRRLFSSYSTICSELGQNKTASKCLNLASFKLRNRNNG